MDSNYKELLERIITLKNLIINSKINIEKSSELISMFILSENIVNLKKLCILDENINTRHFSKFRNSLAHLKTLKFDHELEIYKNVLRS